LNPVSRRSIVGDGMAAVYSILVFPVLATRPASNVKGLGRGFDSGETPPAAIDGGINHLC
jgi:hypothetical protein